MILKNYKVLKKTFAEITYSSQSAGQNPNTDTEAKDASGNTVAVCNKPYSNYSAPNYAQYFCACYSALSKIDAFNISPDVIPDDNTVYAPVSILSKSNSIVTNNFSFNNDVLSNTITLTGENNSGSEYTIASVWLIKDIAKGSAGTNMGVTSASVYIAAFDLAEPITVPAGQGFSITVTWAENDMN